MRAGAGSRRIVDCRGGVALPRATGAISFSRSDRGLKALNSAAQAIGLGYDGIRYAACRVAISKKIPPNLLFHFPFRQRSAVMEHFE
jgi:hypothetical protein